MSDSIKVWVIKWRDGGLDNRFHEKESEAWMRMNRSFNTDEAVRRGFTIQPMTLTKGHKE